VIKSHVNTDNSNAAWLLLSLITPHIPLRDPHFVMEYFNTSIHTPEGVGLYTLLQVRVAGMQILDYRIHFLYFR
jgi:hypothetical protein